MTNLAKLELTAGCLFAVSFALSMIHPWGDPHSNVQSSAPLLEGSAAPDKVRSALESKCGDCHSEKTHYPLYSHLAPVSWVIEHDVREGRQNLDMSQWQTYSDEDRVNLLTKMASEVHTGQMPPRMYAVLHPGARLNQDEEQVVYDWAKAERKRIRQELSHRTDQSRVEIRRENQ